MSNNNQNKANAEQEKINKLIAAAEQGDIEAQRNLGIDYYEGFYGLEKDYKEALKWFRMAAEKNDASAQFLLGSMYRYGEGVEIDYSEAARWYRMAAEQGDAEAQDSLGILYTWGDGVEIDYIEAVKWFRKSAVQGNHHSMMRHSSGQ